MHSSSRKVLIMVDAVEQIIELKEDVGQLKGAMGEMNKTLESIRGYLAAGTDQRTNNHSNIVKQIAEISTVQGIMVKSVEVYQKECTEDRKKQDERLEKVEKRMVYQTAFAAAVGSVFVSVGWAIDHFRGAIANLFKGNT